VSGSTNDKTALDQLVAMGADPEVPVAFVNYLYFKDNKEALSAKSALESQSSDCQARRSAYDSSWLVTFRVMLRPQLGEIARMRAELESLARRLKGEYDGWEVEI